MALLPFRNPITDETAYFGVIDHRDVDLIWLQVPFQYLALLLPSQLSQNRPQLPPQLGPAAALFGAASAQR